MNKFNKHNISPVNKQAIFKKLETIIDPELNVNIVDLGLIYGVEINQKSGKVDIKMTLTSPGCPLSFVFEQWIREKVMKIKGVENVTINLVWEPMWTPDNLSENAKEQLGILK